MIASSSAFWLHSRRYDLAWYVATPIALYVLLSVASAALGPKGPATMYLLSSVLTGLPHNMITWLLVMPESARRHYVSGLFFGPAVLTAIALAPTIWWHGTPQFAWALSITIVIAYYHITRQHMGLLHSSDARYAQATGESDFRPYTRDLRWAVGAVAAAAFLWKTTGGPMRLGLGDPMVFAFAPLPAWLPAALTAFSIWLIGRFAWRTWARQRAGKPLASAHLAIGGSAIGNLVLAALVPNDQFFLTLALVASYHNLQYFAFCYTHHHQRASADAEATDVFSRWARDGKLGRWIALPLALGVGFALAVSVLPAFWMVLLSNAFMISHYFVDANIWRRKFYPAMGRFASRVVGRSA